MDNSNKRVYLDNNATTMLDPRAKELMEPYFCEKYPEYHIINIDKLSIEFNFFVDKLVELGKEKALEIHVMHEDIFNLMHKI